MAFVSYDKNSDKFILHTNENIFFCSKCKKRVEIGDFYRRIDNKRYYHKQCLLMINEEFEANPIGDIINDQEENTTTIN